MTALFIINRASEFLRSLQGQVLFSLYSLEYGFGVKIKNKMNEDINRGRGTTRSGQAGLKCPHLAGGEDGALFIIKHMVRRDISPRRPYRLFLKRKNGYKFKKSFRTREEALWHVEPYLRLCCTVCKENGIVQKVSDVGGIRDGISNFPRDQLGKWIASNKFHPDGNRGRCMLCQTEHEVYYEGHMKKLRVVPS